MLNSNISNIQLITRNHQRRTIHLDELYTEECFVCKHKFTFKLVYMQDGMVLPDGRAFIMPRCVPSCIQHAYADFLEEGTHMNLNVSVASPGRNMFRMRNV